MRISKQTGLAAASLLLICANGWADTISLPLTDDAFINGNTPDLNLGADENLLIHNYGPKYALVRFDAASIAGQAVNSATLTLYLNGIRSAGTIRFLAMESSWNESSVTWNSVDPTGPQPPQEATETAVVDLATADVGSAISIDVTHAVQRWADGSLADAGFLIVTDDGIKAYFDAKEKTGGIPASLEVDTGPPPFTGEAIVLDLSDPDNCTIDEPGYYVLDRSWYATLPYGGEPEPAEYGCGITVRASATLDMRGFFLKGGQWWPNYEPMVRIESGDVTIRNGRLEGTFVAIEGLTGTSVRLEHMHIFGNVDLDVGTVVMSRLSGGGILEILILNKGVVADSVFHSSELPVIVGGSGGVQIRNNEIHGYGYAIAVWSDSIVKGNSITFPDIYGSGDNGFGIHVYGANTIVAHNVLTYSETGRGNGIIVQGSSLQGVVSTANVIDGNIISGPSVGLFFGNGDIGNYFGGNRVSATAPYVGTDAQVDWGGNVSF